MNSVKTQFILTCQRIHLSFTTIVPQCKSAKKPWMSTGIYLQGNLASALPMIPVWQVIKWCVKNLQCKSIAFRHLFLRRFYGSKTQDCLAWLMCFVSSVEGEVLCCSTLFMWYCEVDSRTLLARQPSLRGSVEVILTVLYLLRLL